MSDKIKILYVDDEKINLVVFETNFYRDYQILMAENGTTALQILDENPDIKVVISDMRMPGMNGVEFIKQAKNNFPDIRYYILTGYTIATDIQDAVDNELIIKYFIKPFKPQEIKSEIAKSISA